MLDEEENVDSPDEFEVEGEKSFVETPKSKRARRNELTAKEKKEIAKSKVKLFCNKWMEADEFRGWVEAVSENSKQARCRACNVVLVAGKSELSKHAGTSKHQKNVKTLQGVKRLEQCFVETPESRAERKLKESVKVAEIKLATFFAEHNISIMSSDHLVELVKDCFPDSQIAQKITLDRTKCTAIITNVLAATEKEGIANDLRNNKFSVLVDESTDKGSKKNMCVVVKYVCPTSGKPISTLFEMIELNPQNCSAEALYGRFKDTFVKKHNIPITNIVGLACDNAPVMVGANNSFYTRLKADCPWLVLLNCICHSSDIAASHACKKLPSNVEGLVRRIANYVTSSPKRSSIVEEFQDYYHTEKLKFLNPSRTRWLVLHPCVVRILNNLTPLREYFTLCKLEDAKDKEAAAILEDLTNPFSVSYLKFLKYTLEPFNKMNAFFQTEGVLVHKLKSVSLCYLKKLCQNYMRPNVIPSVATVDVTHPHIQLPLEQVYLGPEVDDDLKAFLNQPVPQGMTAVQQQQFQQQRAHDVHTFRLRCLDFYVTAAKQMKAFFPLNNPVIDEARFIDPKIALSAEERKDLPELKHSVANFQGLLGLDKEAVAAEWRSLPYAFSDEQAAKLRELSPEDFWREVGKLRDFSDTPLCPQLCKLANVVLTLPHSNADSERSFSIVTDVKTAKRNSMGNSTLDAICVTRSAMKRRKVPCFKYVVTEDHLKKHNKDMYQYEKFQYND